MLYDQPDRIVVPTWSVEELQKLVEKGTNYKHLTLNSKHDNLPKYLFATYLTHKYLKGVNLL